MNYLEYANTFFVEIKFKLETNILHQYIQVLSIEGKRVLMHIPLVAYDNCILLLLISSLNLKVVLYIIRNWSFISSK